MNCLTRINSDLYDIALRVKEIDSGYYVVFNNFHKRYEIHNEKAYPTLSLIADGPLDVRIIKRLWKTHIKRYDKIIEEIEKANDEAEKRNNKEISDRVADKSKSLMQYLENGGEEIPPYQEI